MAEKRLNVRMSDEEYKNMMAWAKKNGVNVSAWVRAKIREAVEKDK